MSLVAPTGARLVVLPDQVPSFRNMYTLSVPPSWPAKDPSEILTYAADFAALIESPAKATEVQASASNAVISGVPELQGSVAVIEIKGGTDGTFAPVSIAVWLDSGEVIVRTVTLPILVQQGSPGIPAFAAIAASVSSGTAGSVNLTTTYTYTQVTPAAVWDIVHNLGRNPAVAVTDTSGNEVEGDVTFVSLNELTLTFSSPFAGTAYLT